MGLSVNLMLASGAWAGLVECDALSWLLTCGGRGGLQGSLMLAFTPGTNILRGVSQLAGWPGQTHPIPFQPWSPHALPLCGFPTPR